MTQDQVVRLRRWADSLAEDGRGEPAEAARTIGSLADRIERLHRGEPSRWEPGEAGDARRLARRLSDGSGPPARRSAARAITLLLEETDRLEDDLLRVAATRVRERDGGAAANGSAAGRNGNGNGRRSVAAPPARRPPPRRRMATLLPSRRTGLRFGAGAVAVALLAALVVFGPRLAAPDISVDGPAGDKLGAADVADGLMFSVTTKHAKKARWRVDGREADRGVSAAFSTSRLSLAHVRDGRHTVEVEVGGPIPGATARHAWTFTVDRTPADVELDDGSGRAEWGKPVTVAGSVEDGATVTVAGRDAPVEDGRFSATFPAPKRGAVRVEATDEFGNVARERVPIVVVPRRPPEPIRAVHMTFYSWKNASLREPVLRMIDEGRIDAVELDLKDESGVVGFAADIPLGKRIGAVEKIYDLKAAVRMLHARGVRVIGRLVCFRDPILAAAAWKAGHEKEVVQTPGGGPYSGYGGFTNFADPVVRKYNIDVARAAAAAGVDEILYDYVRRPDGPRSSMVFPGLKGHEDKSIAGFLRETREALPEDVFLGASVFGVAASRPQDVAQNIPMMARELDYVAPMVYPSHWSSGEYNVPNPNAQPYPIVLRSLRDFQRQVKGTGARVVPWLQDFSLGVTYGPEQVRAEISAAARAGAPEWILWDPAVTYTASALDPHS